MVPDVSFMSILRTKKWKSVIRLTYRVDSALVKNKLEKIDCIPVKEAVIASRLATKGWGLVDFSG